MGTEHRWRNIAAGVTILGLLAFSLLNDSWPGDVAFGAMLVGVLGASVLNWRRERHSRTSTELSDTIALLRRR
jgi:hypothetical protein